MMDRPDYIHSAGISLLDYLAQQGWRPVRDNGRDEVAGLCPLHRDSRPSFYVNRRKQVFDCHGCGRGGGLARLIRWLGDLTPPVTDHCPEHLIEDAGISTGGSWRDAITLWRISPNAASRIVPSSNGCASVMRLALVCAVIWHGLDTAARN